MDVAARACVDVEVTATALLAPDGVLRAVDLAGRALEVLLVAQFETGPAHGVRGVLAHEAQRLREEAALRVDAHLLFKDGEFPEVVGRVRQRVVRLLVVARGEILVAPVRARIGVHDGNERQVQARRHRLDLLHPPLGRDRFAGVDGILRRLQGVEAVFPHRLGHGERDAARVEDRPALPLRVAREDVVGGGWPGRHEVEVQVDEPDRETRRDQAQTGERQGEPRNLVPSGQRHVRLSPQRRAVRFATAPPRFAGGRDDAGTASLNATSAAFARACARATEICPTAGLPSAVMRTIWSWRG